MRACVCVCKKSSPKSLKNGLPNECIKLFKSKQILCLYGHDQVSFTIRDPTELVRTCTRSISEFDHVSRCV